MNTFQTFEEFLKTSSAHIPVIGFIINLILTAVLSGLLNIIYVRYGNSFSNRKIFGKNFLLITMTTMLIITIVKSSLALSLGLVGALSIIRFRAAIKEPEELAYIFFAIAIGLGFGANQGVITCVAFFIMTILLIITKKYSTKHDDDNNLHLSIINNNPKTVSVDEIFETIKYHSSEVILKRLDETNDILDISLLVQINNYKKLIEIKNALQKLNKDLNITFLDNKDLI